VAVSELDCQVGGSGLYERRISSLSGY